MCAATDESRRSRGAGAFDVRRIIAMLFVIYGLVLTVMGLVATSRVDIEQAAGININLYSGLGMLVFAGCFFLWAYLRPIIIPEDTSAES